MIRMKNVYIEIKPEEYVSPNISITIHAKPSHKRIAEAMMAEAYLMIAPYNHERITDEK